MPSLTKLHNNANDFFNLTEYLGFYDVFVVYLAWFQNAKN